MFAVSFIAAPAELESSNLSFTVKGFSNVSVPAPECFNSFIVAVSLTATAEPLEASNLSVTVKGFWNVKLPALDGHSTLPASTGQLNSAFPPELNLSVVGFSVPVVSFTVSPIIFVHSSDSNK